eukprot:CAMPEP_0174316584 /NCGR_PEP_ID=MMETSP0810-20121108/7034_1 /TAXON_ID=73025 ORGANISM="Eutreptiella gymnastica-like, Strain CCMP1594" /NCGR_SAMPLE_ID=MMETSP0810 /ASSEMBLY_ACC=CAM_ASM_000659 /LENGTH=246 /DNA_ID=CAMNT_0015426319 /DNA_START=333 /DNA_END=1070 /DNA_ORIENTATION=+
MNTSQCEVFGYGGCAGNGNRFDTQEACEKRCDCCGTVLEANIGATSGGESTVAQVGSSGECCDICRSTAFCVGWVYMSDQVCYQKKAASAAGVSLSGGPQDPQGTHSAGLITDCCGTVLEANIGATSGGESTVAQVESSAECCSICRSTALCVGWVYMSDQVCYQKKAASAAGVSLSGGPQDPQGTHSAGLITDCCGTVLEANIGATSGGESTVAQVESSAECCSICRSTALCVGWVYMSDQVCYQ